MRGKEVELGWVNDFFFGENWICRGAEVGQQVKGNIKSRDYFKYRRR